MGARNSGGWTPKPCPVPNGIYLAAGYTQMMLSVRTIKTWNATTKQFEVMVRPGIVKGPAGEKQFRFSQSKLI